jgi:arylsulfatase A-like enzyme
VIERWGWVQAEAGGDGLEVGRSTMQPLWDFLDAHGDARFFVWFAPKLPHTPHDAGPEWLQVYPKESLSKSARRYYANVTRLDARVGEILAYLDRTGLRKKTLLVYLSDNGWEQGPHENPDPRLGGPKGKWSIYELGFRTPVIFSWPGRIEAGRVRDDLVAAVDVFTTLVAFAGLDRPKNRYGIDLRPMLLGDAPPTRTRVVGNMEALRPPENSTFGMGKTAFVRPERAYFLRDRSWRYIWYRDAGKYVDRSEEELYRIDRDPMETRNVIAEFPAVAANFRNEILLWLDEMKRPFR